VKQPSRVQPGELTNTTEATQGFIDRVFPGFGGTDPQFNVGRFVDGIAVGADLVNSTDNRRIYVTEGSSETSERMVVEMLGKVVLPPSRIVHPSFLGTDKEAALQTYEIPFGARPVRRTLEQSPYRDAYMQRLSFRVGELLGKLRKLDAGIFGLNVDAVAIGHNGSEHGDDTRLFIVPPLLDKGSVSPIKEADILEAIDEASDVVKGAMKEGFRKGSGDRT
jgi:hypothetical protein